MYLTRFSLHKKEILPKINPFSNLFQLLILVHQQKHDKDVNEELNQLFQNSIESLGKLEIQLFGHSTK